MKTPAHIRKTLVRMIPIIIATVTIMGGARPALAVATCSVEVTNGDWWNPPGQSTAISHSNDPCVVTTAKTACNLKDIIENGLKDNWCKLEGWYNTSVGYMLFVQDPLLDSSEDYDPTSFEKRKTTLSEPVTLLGPWTKLKPVIIGGYVIRYTEGCLGKDCDAADDGISRWTDCLLNDTTTDESCASKQTFDAWEWINGNDVNPSITLPETTDDGKMDRVVIDADLKDDVGKTDDHLIAFNLAGVAQMQFRYTKIVLKHGAGFALNDASSVTFKESVITFQHGNSAPFIFEVISPLINPISKDPMGGGDRLLLEIEGNLKSVMMLHPIPFFPSSIAVDRLRSMVEFADADGGWSLVAWSDQDPQPVPCVVVHKDASGVLRCRLPEDIESIVPLVKEDDRYVIGEFQDVPLDRTIEFTPEAPAFFTKGGTRITTFTPSCPDGSSPIFGDDGTPACAVANGSATFDDGTGAWQISCSDGYITVESEGKPVGCIRDCDSAKATIQGDACVPNAGFEFAGDMETILEECKGVAIPAPSDTDPSGRICTCTDPEQEAVLVGDEWRCRDACVDENSDGHDPKNGDCICKEGYKGSTCSKKKTEKASTKSPKGSAQKSIGKEEAREDISTSDEPNSTVCQGIFCQTNDTAPDVRTTGDTSLPAASSGGCSLAAAAEATAIGWLLLLMLLAPLPVVRLLLRRP